MKYLIALIAFNTIVSILSVYRWLDISKEEQKEFDKKHKKYDKKN